MHAFKRMYLLNEISYEYTVWTTLLHPTIVAQLSVILDKFAFEKNFCCFLDDNYTDTTCNKGKTEQRKLVKVT